MDRVQPPANKDSTGLSLFSGVGGFDLAFQRQGFHIAGMCEIDKHAQAVLRYRFPDTPLEADVTTLPGMRFGPVDVVVGGFPCQDVSLAGRRKGLQGERSGLFHEAVRVIREMQEATNGKYPRFALIENVPGLLTSNKGQDFRTVLQEILQAEVPMPRSGRWANAGMVRGNGCSVAWRVLDSQHFGVPQRRRRIFLVADFAGGRAAEILFERESLPGHPPQGGKAGQEVAGPLDARTQAGGFPGTDGAASGHVVPVTAPTVLASWGHHGRSSPGGDGNGPTVPVPSSIGFNWQNWTNDGLAITEEGTGPLDTSQTKAVAYQEGEVAQTVLTGTGRRYDAETETLVPVAEPPAIALTERGREGGRHLEWQADKAYALTNPGQGGRTQSRMVATPYRVRRLVPVETEILQGFPTSWTSRGIDEAGKQYDISDTQRYRMCGNAVSVPVVEWLARRFRRVLASEAQPEYLKEAA